MKARRLMAWSAALWALAAVVGSAALAQTEPLLPRPRPQPLALIPPAPVAEPYASGSPVDLLAPEAPAGPAEQPEPDIAATSAEIPAADADAESIAPLPRPRPDTLGGAAGENALESTAETAPAAADASPYDTGPLARAATDTPPMETAAAKFAATGAQSYVAGIPDGAGLIFDELELPRIPRPRPPGEPPAPRIEQASLPVAPPFFPSADEAACRRRLADLGVVFTEAEPIDPNGVCHVRAPISVSSIGAGIALTPEAILNCRTTEALALWAQDVMAPAARTHLSAMPTEIRHASTYVCRPRNNQAGARLSEHANANAVDIGSIAFAGREPVDVRARGPAQAGLRSFQRAIRAGACAYFTTVLGPGSDASHADHFHFDMAERRGGYRLCD